MQIYANRLISTFFVVSLINITLNDIVMFRVIKLSYSVFSTKY